MNLNKTAAAGSGNKGDALVRVAPNNENSIIIILNSKSIVKKQFGSHIEELIRETALDEGVSGAVIQVDDKGALDFTIRARVRSALLRTM